MYYYHLHQYRPRWPRLYQVLQFLNQLSYDILEPLFSTGLPTVQAAAAHPRGNLGEEVWELAEQYERLCEKRGIL